MNIIRQSRRPVRIPRTRKPCERGHGLEESLVSHSRLPIYRRLIISRRTGHLRSTSFKSAVCRPHTVKKPSRLVSIIGILPRCVECLSTVNVLKQSCQRNDRQSSRRSAWPMLKQAPRTTPKIDHELCCRTNGTRPRRYEMFLLFRSALFPAGASCPTSLKRSVSDAS